MATGDVVEPYGSYNFLIEIDGVTRAGFRECSGLDSTISVIEYREGGENTTTRKIPGMTAYSNITLRRGITEDLELYNWHRQAIAGEVERRNGSIIILARNGEEVARWNFVRAWPTKWTGPELNAEGTEIAIETLELAHEGIMRA